MDSIFDLPKEDEIITMKYIRPIPKEEQRHKRITVIIPEFLYLTTISGIKELKSLQKLKITHIISCMRLDRTIYPQKNPHVGKKERVEYETFHQMMVPVDDSQKENISKYFEKAVEFIEKAKTSGGRVIVHCFAAVSRSVSIIISYLMAKYDFDFESAYSFVGVAKPDVSPNKEFRVQLRKWYKKLKKQKP